LWLAGFQVYLGTQLRTKEQITPCATLHKVG
jgi:hypothetical protein